jgi:hypothetical protein
MTDGACGVPNEKSTNLAVKPMFSPIGMVNSPLATLPQMEIHFLFMETVGCDARKRREHKRPVHGCQ